MAKVGIADFDLVLLYRTAEARKRRGLKQDQIAELLDIPQDRYQKYENRNVLPPELIHRFCVACGINAMTFLKPPQPAEVEVAKKWWADKPRRASRET